MFLSGCLSLGFKTVYLGDEQEDVVEVAEASLDCSGELVY